MTTAIHLAAHKTEALLFFTLLQLTAIVLAARIGGEITLRIGQSAVVGEIVIGILLGPSLSDSRRSTPAIAISKPALRLAGGEAARPRWRSMGCFLLLDVLLNHRQRGGCVPNLRRLSLRAKSRW